jgi:hypothetical protein
MINILIEVTESIDELRSMVEQLAQAMHMELTMQSQLESVKNRLDLVKNELNIKRITDSFTLE